MTTRVHHYRCYFDDARKFVEVEAGSHEEAAYRAWLKRKDWTLGRIVTRYDGTSYRPQRNEIVKDRRLAG